jgi:hypothetical protein
MPQMRSFSSFIPAPRLAESYGRGIELAQADEQLAAKIMLEREGMANQAGIAAANRGFSREELGAKMQMQQAALAQQTQEAQMQDAMRREALQQEMLQKAQELEVDKAYKQQVIGLRGRELEQDNQKIMSAAAAAENELNARREFASQMDAMTSSGEVSPEDAYAQLAPKFIPLMNAPSGAYGRGGLAAGPATVPKWSRLQGEGVPADTTMGLVQTGPNTFTTLDLAKGATAPLEAKPLPGDASRMQVGKSTYSNPEYKEMLTLQKDRQDKAESLADAKKWGMHHIAWQKKLDGKELTKGEKSLVAQWQTQLDALKKLDDEIAPLRRKFLPGIAGTNAAPATLPPGVGGGSTNQSRFKIITR